jgi:hypothetical protein
VETLFTILPFLAILLISLNAYYRYKNRGKEEESTWTDKYSFTRDVMTAFKRVKYRPWTFLFFFPSFFGLILGIITLFSNIQNEVYPPLPLEKMLTKQGVVESIKERKKMDDLLIFRTKDGEIEKYAYRLYGSKNNLLEKNVTIFYTKGFSSAYTIDNKVYQINSIDTNKSIELHPYNYERSLQINKSFWKFTMWSFIIGFLSGFMMWYANRKELPVHKLNKMKMDAKEKERKK